MSKAHFARCFRAAFGIPPHRYVLSRRIERAKALLRDTEASVTDIAFRTGWNSLGTFTRVFRDIVEESPMAFRRQVRVTPANLHNVPHCFVIAACRPDLTIAVSEKRRRRDADTLDP